MTYPHYSVKINFPERANKNIPEGKMPPVTIHWYEGNATKRFTPPSGLTPEDCKGYNEVFVGSKGFIGTSGRGESVRRIPESAMKDFVKPDKLIERSPGHFKDWIRACKGGPAACSDFSIAGPYVEWLLLGTIAWRWAKSRIDGVMQLGAVGLAGQLNFAWEALTTLMMDLAVGLVIIALLDYPIQWLRRRNRLRMSLQEVKDEHKEQDGSPEAKAHRRQRQRQIAMGSIARAMRDAQFILTNPTHFAVVMTYDPSLAPAPVVLAKGRGDKALAIRQLAAEHGVPVLEFPALARSVYYTTRERQMIREELYAAVAGILAFVFSLKRGETPQAPHIEVPIELRYDPDGRADPEAIN